MAEKKPMLAVVFDFDETLTDDSTSQLLSRHGIDVDDFWTQVEALYDRGFDPTEAYLMHLVKELRRRDALDQLRDGNLRRFGASLEFHPGVQQLFGELQDSVDGKARIQFFVISGGLLEIIAGSTISSELTDFWGCTYHWDRQFAVPYPKNSVSFTEKTKHIFQISKGLIGSRYKNRPYEVNEAMDERKLHIPLENIIYIGDGLTDIPCFSIVSRGNGHAICVYNRTKTRREGLQRTARKMDRRSRDALTKAMKAVAERDVRGPYKADYTTGSDLREYIEHACRVRGDGSRRW